MQSDLVLLRSITSRRYRNLCIHTVYFKPTIYTTYLTLNGEIRVPFMSILEKSDCIMMIALCILPLGCHLFGTLTDSRAGPWPQPGRRVMTDTTSGNNSNATNWPSTLLQIDCKLYGTHWGWIKMEMDVFVETPFLKYFLRDELAIIKHWFR